MTYFYVGDHAQVLSSGRSIGFGDTVEPPYFFFP